MTTTTETTPTPAAPISVSYHWVMTVQFDHGRQTATYDGSINVAPGQHTRMGSYAFLREHMQQTVGTDQFVVLFFALEPNQL